MLWLNILFLILGYLLGSINPGYLFGRIKGIDIRQEGTKNAGTSNTYRVLGIGYAIPTAAYDTLKGVGVVLLALSLGVDPFYANLSGIFTILGHIFPFYLRFRGGQGVAAATGLLLYYLLNYFVLNPWFFLLMPYLGLIVIIYWYITRIGNVLGVMTLPLLAYAIWISYPFNEQNLFITILLGQIVIIGIYNIINRKLFKIEDEDFRIRWWRVITRPFAFLFMFFYLVFDQLFVLIFLGSVASIFILLDLIRIFHEKSDRIIVEKAKKIYRKEERKTFSSMTVFLVSLFISILLFEKNIAIAATTFLIFGDTFGKIFGLAFGKKWIIKQRKSVEGTLAYIGAMLIFGYILFTSLNISFWILLIGCLTAPLVELLSIRPVNDNLTVPLISGTTMTVALLIKTFYF
jgi:glycerol-3-phosphate acyltransferase PlsY